uniref:Uncharacterized protein n=1 Tax=Anguilla anguilla TaxID=7936 RepID=A0A0E9TQG9_ANGAN
MLIFIISDCFVQKCLSLYLYTGQRPSFLNAHKRSDDNQKQPYSID